MKDTKKLSLGARLVLHILSALSALVILAYAAVNLEVMFGAPGPVFDLFGAVSLDRLYREMSGSMGIVYFLLIPLSVLLLGWFLVLFRQHRSRLEKPSVNPEDFTFSVPKSPVDDAVKAALTDSISPARLPDLPEGLETMTPSLLYADEPSSNESVLPQDGLTKEPFPEEPAIHPVSEDSHMEAAPLHSVLTPREQAVLEELGNTFRQNAPPEPAAEADKPSEPKSAPELFRPESAMEDKDERSVKESKRKIPDMPNPTQYHDLPEIPALEEEEPLEKLYLTADEIIAQFRRDMEEKDGKYSFMRDMEKQLDDAAINQMVQMYYRSDIE